MRSAMMTARFAALSVLGSLCALTGCMAQQDRALAEASVSSALSTSQNAGMQKILYDMPKSTECLDPAAAAAEAADRPAVGLYPSSCAVKTADGPNLHVELERCTGPFGRVHLEGGLDAKFSSKSCDELHADVADSGDFTGNDRPIDYSASADITVDGVLRNVDWAGHWTATTEQGDDAEQTSDLAIVVDSSTNCLAVDGSTTGHVGEWQIDATLEGLKACPDKCPSAGTVGISVEGKRAERSLTIEFDGSSVAKVTGTKGEAFEVDMVCAGDES